MTDPHMQNRNIPTHTNTHTFTKIRIQTMTDIYIHTIHREIVHVSNARTHTSNTIHT